MKFQQFLMTFYYISIADRQKSLLYKGNFPFGGITVTRVGYFLQLVPVRARPVYAEYKNIWHNLDSLWRLFEIVEHTEVMRQRRDNNFINLLNHVRKLTLVIMMFP